jgi:hypothetical protein
MGWYNLGVFCTVSSTLKMGKDLASETLEKFQTLTRKSAREDFLLNSVAERASRLLDWELTAKFQNDYVYFDGISSQTPAMS